MSRVFVALETSLQRKVVVKVLLSVERFRREIYLAASSSTPTSASRGSRDKFLRRRALLNFA
jgi:hypothetical protein